MMIIKAPLNVTDKKLPHGNIDIMTPGTDTIATSNIGVMIVDGESSQVKLATSVKRKHTIHSLQSHKHACFIYSYTCNLHL